MNSAHAFRFASGACLLLALSANAACTRTSNADPGPQDQRDDAVALHDVLGADQALESALRDVDSLARTNPTGAAALIDSRAIPLSDQVVARADAVAVHSSWGADRKSEFAAIAHARRDALPGYASALRSADLQAQLGALEAQLELQRRAMDVASRVSQVPP